MTNNFPQRRVDKVAIDVFAHVARSLEDSYPTQGRLPALSDPWPRARRVSSALVRRDRFARVGLTPISSAISSHFQ